MDLKRLQQNWNGFGEVDPYWAILTDSRKKENRWDPAEFLATGVAEIAHVMNYVERTAPLREKGLVLDFGCGVGRLTQALAEHFDRVTGVDIAPSMLRRAREINRHGERCEYVLNESDDLRRFANCSYDFIYSNITLQHMRPIYIRRYVREFVRVLKPGGVALFQVPSDLVKKPGMVRRAIGAVLAKATSMVPSGSPKMEMHGVERQVVIETLESAGALVVDVSPDGAPGPDWYSYRYCARKR